MSPANSLRLDRLRILRTPGIAEPFAVEGLSPQVNLVHGPNASGKTSTARIIEAIRGNQHRVLPVSTLQTGAYGINDVCLSLPTVVTADGAGDVLEIPLSEQELAGLQASAATLHDAWASVSGQ